MSQSYLERRWPLVWVIVLSEQAALERNLRLFPRYKAVSSIFALVAGFLSVLH